MDSRSRARQQLLQLRQDFLPSPRVFGELDVDLQVQIASGVTALVRHALARDLENLAGTQHVARFLGMGDLDTAAVEVLEDHARETAEGFGEGDLDGGKEVGAGAREDGVLELVDVEDNVTWLDVGDLVAFALEDNFVAGPRM